MTLSAQLKQAAYALPLVFTLAATDANAAGLTPGQCYAKADAEAVLKQEGQMPIIVGNRNAIVPVSSKNPTGVEVNANVFFVNKQGYGYNIEGNAPVGTPSKQLCVAATFKNANLNNPNNPEMPSWAKNIKASSNGIDPHKAYANGARFVLGAQTYTPKSNGTEVLGKYIVVSAVGSNAGVWGVDLAGNPDTAFDMDKVGFTKQMAELVNGTVASRQVDAPVIALNK